MQDRNICYYPLVRSYARLIVENQVNNSMQQSSSLEVRGLSGSQDVCVEFYGKRKFVAVFTKAFHFPPS